MSENSTLVCTAGCDGSRTEAHRINRYPNKGFETMIAKRRI
jgi:hypothetical protein